MSIIKKIFIILFLTWHVSANAEYMPVQSWQYYLKRGRLQFNAAMYDYSYDSMTKALKKNPRCFEAANTLAQIHLIEKDRENAKKNFILSLSVKDNQPRVHNSLGEIEEFFLNYSSAIVHYRKAVEYDKTYTGAMINLSRMLNKTGREKEAEKILARAYELALGKSSVLIEKARSTGKNEAGRKEELYLRAIAANPAHTEAYLELSALYRGRGHFTKAAKLLENLKRVRPRYIRVYLHLGSIYFNRKLKGNTRRYFLGQALKNYLAAEKLGRTDPDLFIKISESYKALGNELRAEEYNKKAQQLSFP